MDEIYDSTNYPFRNFYWSCFCIVSAQLILFDASEASEKFSKIELKFDQKLSKRAP